MPNNFIIVYQYLKKPKNIMNQLIKKLKPENIKKSIYIYIYIYIYIKENIKYQKIQKTAKITKRSGAFKDMHALIRLKF